MEKKKGSGGGRGEGRKGKREREKEGKGSYRLKIIAFTLSLSLSSSSREYLYLEYTPFTLPSLLSRSLFSSQASFSILFFFLYILDPEPSSRHSNESFRSWARATLTLCFSILAHERTEIYTLQFRIPARISKARYGSRFRKAGYLLRDLCSPLFDNSPSFRNI